MSQSRVSITFKGILRALHRGKVNYAIGGGLAVVLHGWPRLTADADLFIALTPANIKRFYAVMDRLGYQAPVTQEEFSDPRRRAIWRTRHGLIAIRFHHRDHLAPEVDIFVNDRLTQKLLKRKIRTTLESLTVHVISLPDLISLKKKSGRPLDLEDIHRLSRKSPKGKPTTLGRPETERMDFYIRETSPLERLNWTDAVRLELHPSKIRRHPASS